MRLWLALPVFALAATATARPAAGESTLGGIVKVQTYIPKTEREPGTAPSMDEDAYEEKNLAATTLPNEVKRYFNMAHCQCDRLAPAMPEATTSQLFMLKLSWATGMEPTPAPGATPLEVWAGKDCEKNDTQPDAVAMQCSRLTTLMADELKNAPIKFAQVGDLLAPGATGMTPNEMPNECSPTRVSESTVIVTSGSGPRVIESDPLVFKFDLQPPTMPTDVSATGLESAIRISWEAPNTAPAYYQALCAKADGSPAHSLTDGTTANATDSPRFDTVGSVCDETPEPPAVATIDGDETATGELPAPLLALDRNYICGEATGTTSSIDLTGLDNDTSYWVVVVAIDDWGNYEAVYLPRTIQPVPSIDFWEDLNEERPEVDGGFCVSQVGRNGSAGSALLVLGAAGLAVRRRRRRRAQAATAAAVTTLAVLALAPGAARAQSWEPYWIDSEAESADRFDDPEWHVGLRVGPYYPAIDEGFDSDPGPYRRMFGPGYNLVPQLDLHRVWQLAGVQLGVGVSGGYYQKSAKTYALGSSPDDPDRPRTDAENTFKMIPLSVTGLARLTVLDDRWGIPVIPYVRGGGAYNVWWVRTATGELAMTNCDTCKDKALGASAGVVGAVGIAIRGERLDNDSLASMRNGGVEHAGFYAEIETSWVDGFGNEARLSLGDTTWYAGLDFEF